MRRGGRIIGNNQQSLDYALWEQIGSSAATVSRDEGKYLAQRDRGPSSSSDFFSKGGRERTREDQTTVFDFVSLSKSLEPWFDAVRLDGANLLEEIQEKANGLRGGPRYFEGVGEEWLRIEWNTLGRVIGASLASIGRSEGWWRWKGNDSLYSIRFWGDIERSVQNDDISRGVSEAAWEDAVTTLREKNFDPSSEMLRAQSHRPSAPYWKRGDDHGITYFPNPLALLHKQQMNYLYSRMTEAEEIRDFHGKLNMELIKRAMVKLGRGRTADFAISIHGLCAHHVMRTVALQQKIGLHLTSNLAIRRETRGVGAQNVPDIAGHLKTGFPLAKILHILNRSKVIDWYTIDKDVVDAEMSRL